MQIELSTREEIALGALAYGHETNVNYVQLFAELLLRIYEAAAIENKEPHS